ncbi:hypothetical protein CW304_28075 [Bacillus sp. UFRGS-B20]|nr:hypothetical protein CW304_28075 [Bacillus sp. UFRGS-B20]
MQEPSTRKKTRHQFITLDTTKPRYRTLIFKAGENQNHRKVAYKKILNTRKRTNANAEVAEVQKNIMK